MSRDTTVLCFYLQFLQSITMKEMWLPVVDYEELYKISNTGRIFSNKFNRCLHPYTDKDGYLKINLYKDGKRRAFRMHRLVALAFIPNPDGHPEVHHINKKRADNKSFNLEWRNLHHYNRELEASSNICIGILDAITDDVLYLAYSYETAAAFSQVPEELIKKALAGTSVSDIYKFTDLTF